MNYFKSTLNKTAKNSIKAVIFMPVPPDVTGIAMQLEWIKASVKDQNLNIEIITTTADSETIDGIRITYVNSGFSFPYRFTKALIKSSPDIIHIEYILGLYGNDDRGPLSYLKSSMILFFTLTIPKILRIKVVLSLHKVISGFEDINKSSRIIIKLISLAIKAYNKFLLYFSDKIVVFTEDGKEILNKYHSSWDKVSFIPLPAPKITFSKKFHVNFTYIFFGFIKPNKGIMELLNAFYNLNLQRKNTRLIIAGGIDPSDNSKRNSLYFNSVQERIKELEMKSINIEKHIGYLEENSLKLLLLESDVIVLPYSDNYAEGSGVVSKLLYSGLPFICSSTPRFKSLISKGAALAVAPSDPGDLYLKMLKIYEDKDLYDDISKKSLDMYESFNSEEVFEQYLKLYESLLA